MAESWAQVKKVYRNHHSLVVTLPYFMRKNLAVKRGDYLVFEFKPGGKVVRVKKLDLGASDVRKSRTR